MLPLARPRRCSASWANSEGGRMRGHDGDDADAVLLVLELSLGTGDEWDDMMMGAVQVGLQP